MFSKLIKGGLASAIVGLGLIAAAPQAALAGQSNYGVTIHGTHGSVHIGGIKHRHHDRRYGHNICQPGEAVHKAQRNGLRNAHVDRVGKRYVVVEGRKRGQHVKIGFERNSRNCQVAWIDRSRHHGYRY